MPIWRGTTSTDWNTASNWDTNTVPINTTDAIFDSSAVNDCFLNGDRVCRDLIFNGFARTINLSTFNLTSYRSVTLQSNISGRVAPTTGTLRMAQVTGGTAASGTLTSNGGTWPLNFAGGSATPTITLADTFTVTGNVSINTGPIYLANNFFIGGNFTTGGGGSFSATTTNFIMNGSGTLTMAGGACNLEINTSGTITVSGNISAGRIFTITAVGSLVGLSTANFTFVPYNATNNIINFGPGNRPVQDFATNTSANQTTILNSFTCRDISLIGATYNGPTSPSTATITIKRNYNSQSIITSTNGTLSLVMDGTSVGGGSILNNARIGRLPLAINAGANTISLGAAITVDTAAVLTKTSGNINEGTSTVTISAAASVTISDFKFFNLIVGSGAIVIQNVLNTINSNLTLNGSATFQGAAGWVCANLVSTASGANFTVTLQESVTYRTILQAFITGGTSSVRTTMRSNSGTVRAIWTLDSGASQSMIYVNGTRIDSSQGQTIWSFGVAPADIATTINWNIGSPPGTFAYTFLN